jgi:hypothetical protein
VGRQHLAQGTHLAVGADGDHVVLRAGGLAVVFKGARAVGVFPYLLGHTKTGAHVGFGGYTFFEFANVLFVAARQQAERHQHSQARDPEPGFHHAHPCKDRGRPLSNHWNLPQFSAIFRGSQ